MSNKDFLSFLMTFDNVEELLYIYFMERYALDLWNTRDYSNREQKDLGKHCIAIQKRMKDISFIEDKFLRKYT